MCSKRALLLAAAVWALASSGIGFANEVTEDSYARAAREKGLVLISVNWGRRWGCGGFENGQLMSIAFDLLAPQRPAETRAPDLVLNSPARLMVKPVFLNYALLVEPGEYALSGFNIKAARSVSDVGEFKAQRSQLIKDGEPLGGTFRVAAGEAVYIGHFFLSCHAGPVLWRYYWDGPDPFDKYLAAIKEKYPFLDLSKTQYRLFRTTEFGNDELHEAGSKAERAGDLPAAERSFELALNRARSERALGDSFISKATYNLGRVKGYLCKDKEAEALLLEAMRLEEKASGPGSRVTSMRLNELGRFYYDHDQFDKAVPLYGRGLELAKKLGLAAADPITFANVIEEYAKALESTGRPEDAKAARQEAEDLRAKNPGKKAVPIPRYKRSC